MQEIFSGHYIDVKALYAFRFNALFNMKYIGELDTSAAYAFIIDQLKNEMNAVYQHVYFDHGSADFYFNNTIILLRNKRLIEIGSNYCQVLHTPHHNAWAKELVVSLAAFKIVPTVQSIGFTWEAAAN